MEFATPGHDTGYQHGNSQQDLSSNNDNNNNTGYTMMKSDTTNYGVGGGGAAVSVSSSGNSANFSQVSSLSSAAGLSNNGATQQNLLSRPGISQAQQQQQQGMMPGVFNPLQMAGVLPQQQAMVPNNFGMGNNNGAAIGMPLSAPSSGSNNGPTMTGTKRKSEADLSLASSKEPRTEGDNEDSLSLSGKGPPIKDEAELEKMKPAERRRYERNLREQQRSYRISQQIKELRDVLEESKIPFKPNKFSILVSVVDYIKQLQTRAIMLDAEHQKLIDTIRQTNEMVSSGQVPSSVESSNDSSAAAVTDPVTSGETDSSDLSMAAAKDLSFQTVFRCCPSGMAVCSLDGRILACNKSFESSLGVKKDEVLQQSMFIYIRNHQDIFEGMADLLKRSSVASEAGEGVVRASHLLFWCGHVMSLQNRKSSLTITLSSTSDGNPKYFTLTVGQLT